MQAIMLQLLLLIGPSGSGKSTVAAALQHRGLVTVLPTLTTRPPRLDEAAGSVNHGFVTEVTFADLEWQRYFVGVGRVSGRPYRYGLPHPRTSGTFGVAAVIGRAAIVAPLRRHYPQAVIYHLDAPTPRLYSVAHSRNPATAASEMAASVHERRAGRRLADRTYVNAGSVSELTDAVAAGVAADFATSKSKR